MSAAERKDHSAEICANNVVTVLACKEDTRISDKDKILSDEKKKAFAWNISGKYFDESGEGVVVRLLNRWEISRQFATMEHRATCLIHLSVSMTYYRESYAATLRASGKRYPIEGYSVFSLTI